MSRFEPPRVDGRDYEEIVREFRWRLPSAFNLGTCVDRHPAERLGLLYLPGPGRQARRYTFGELAAQSNRVGNLLGAGLGLERGARVAVLLPPSPEAALAHLGAFKAGMISVPLSTLFGPEALEHRIVDSGAQAVVTDRSGLERLEHLSGTAVSSILLADDDRPAGPVAHGFWALVGAASDRPAAVATKADDPALLIYTSGTSGPPKGVLHAHRVLLGQAPGFRLCHELIPQTGDLMWSPADWAWIGGLVNTLLLSWLYGVPVIAAPRRRFDPDWALELLVRQQVRNTFLPTTALRLMLQRPVPRGLHLRSILAAGEPQEPELLERTRNALGIPFNDVYGQTEADFVVGHCRARWPLRAGSMGRIYPGHSVRIVREDGQVAALNEVGEIVIRVPDPTALLEYWGRPQATAEKLSGGWLRTGDLGRQDDDGYLWFESRGDDVIKSAGYRIGPEEVEQCLRRHEAVASAAVVGAPDELRGQIVTAYVQLRPGVVASEQMKRGLQSFVRHRLAAYQYPHAITFVDALPLTATGKVDRGRLRLQAAGPG
jgi:acetyl-CoA synthetase